MSRSTPGKEAKTVEGELLVYVAGGLFVTAIAWSIAAPLLDDGGDSQWVLWTVLFVTGLCLAGHVASGGVL
ncbi:MAG: hypothetical protein OXH69_23240 [Acidobacteria bacterium]|nr:hypothetical protein [Acidobacteriota bacterium]